MDPGSQTIGSLVDEAAGRSQEDLEALLGPLVLVGLPRVATQTADADDPWAFATSSGLCEPLDDPMVSFRESLVYGIRKARPGPFADTVLVGRASSNDVCIQDPSLSKLHARFHLRPGGIVQLSDSSSKNGTWLNGHRLAPNKPVDVKPGDEVQFGVRTLSVYSIPRLHTLVSKLAGR